MAAVVDKYLRNYGEKETTALVDFPTDRFFENVLVIPAYKETPQFLGQFNRARFSSVLIVLVINQPSDASGAYLPHPINQSLADFIQSNGCLMWRNGNLQLYDLENSSLLVVDRFSRDPVSHKQGVGLARKIGCDLAVALINNHLVYSSVIHTSDADVVLPENYFQQATDEKNVSAQLYRFRHLCDDSDVGLATANYERSIRYYVEGLKWASSPYGFHTIGSCIAVSAVHYCQARGFPRRSGGEDFYLLNKLAKLGRVVELTGSPILIAARTSDRAPFGTGKAVGGILARGNQALYDYDPRIFVALKGVLQLFSWLPERVGLISSQDWLNALPDPGKQALLELGIERFFKHIRSQGYDSVQTTKQIPQWFDGFKTLKFINYLQKHTYPALPQDRALWEFDQLKQQAD